MEDNVENNFLCDDTFNDTIDNLDVSINSNHENSPESININFCNGSPFKDDDFLVLHYNINSITAEGRSEELTLVTSTLKVDVLVCTESKLDKHVPNNIIKIRGFHESILCLLNIALHLRKME